MSATTKRPAWRECDEPWEECDRLGVKSVCRGLHWTRRKLNTEMARVASSEAFLECVRKAVEALDQPMFMARQNGLYHPAQYTTGTAGALDDAEIVPAHYQLHITTTATERFKTMRITENSKRKAHSLEVRLQRVKADARRRHIKIDRELRSIEREVVKAEEKVDRA